MINKRRQAQVIGLVVLMAGVSTAVPETSPARDDCEPDGELQFLCGMPNPEDLVEIPDTQWLVASSMQAGGGLFLINSREKTWSELYSSGAMQADQDMGRFPSCPGQPAAESLVTHGLNVLPGKNGRSTLYVVAHGTRESIEIYDLNSNGPVPAVTWIGCLPAPEGIAFNSVASLGNGSLLATAPQIESNPETPFLFGDITGAVFRWSPGDTGFSLIEGTNLSYPNGVEVSPDGTEFYVASSGHNKLLAFSNSDPARRLRETGELPIIPDNIHRDAHGKLITGGMIHADEVCGHVLPDEPLDIPAVAMCHRPFRILAVDPDSFEVSTIMASPAAKRFSNVTMAIETGNELWIGSFHADRVAYLKSAAD